MAAGSTYTPIATTTLGSAAASYTFSSIPSTYTDLVLIQNPSGTTTNGQDVGLRFNGDSGTNYSRTALSGNGTSAVSPRQSNQTYAYLTYNGYPSGSVPMNFISNIQNYSNSTTYKTVLSRSNNASTGLDANVNLWRNTAAITQIDIYCITGTFGVGSTFTLYGIAAA
jgi:hypothetical protein